jgi:hypothetical protein
MIVWLYFPFMEANILMGILILKNWTDKIITYESHLEDKTIDVRKENRILINKIQCIQKKGKNKIIACLNFFIGLVWKI